MLKLWRRASIIINALVFVMASAQGLLATTYNVVVLPVPGTPSEIIPLGMNDSGQVVGFVASSNNEQAFITDSQSYTFIPLPSGFTLYNPQFTLHSFNNSGQFVATLWAPTGQVPPIPFIGTINGFTPVPLQPVFPPTGWNVFGVSGGVGAINDSGQIVGSGNWQDVNSPCFESVLPFIGTAAGINTIPVPPCTPFAFSLTDINNGGQFVGSEFIAGQAGPSTPIFGTAAGGIAPIPAPTGYLFSSSGDGGFGFTGPFINDSGQIAATFTSDPLGHNPQPFLGNANGFAPIPLPSGCSDGNIQGINDAGEVVGGCFNIIAPYVGTQSGTFLLNSLVPAGWFIESANAINNKGQIAAEAFDSNGIFHAVILTPDTAYPLTKVSGDQQTGNINSALQNPLMVQVTDQNGVPQSNVPITFSTSPAQWPTNAQNASLSTTQSLLSITVATGADGTASSPFVLGSVTGGYQITASCAASQSCTPAMVTFTENGILAPTASVIPKSINFGSVVPGKSRTQRMTIENTGAAGSILTGTLMAPMPPFSIAQGGSNFSLGAGASMDVEVAFEPSTTGSFTDAIVITSNDPVNPTFPVPLSGTSSNLSSVTVWIDAFIPYPSFGPASLLPQLFLLVDPGTLVSATAIDIAGDGRSFSDQSGASHRVQWIQTFDANTLAPTCSAPCLGNTDPSELLLRPNDQIIASGQADPSGVIVGTPHQVGSLVYVNMSGGATFPFLGPVQNLTGGLIPAINVDVTFRIDLINRTCQLVGTHGKFPAFEAYCQANDDPPVPIWQRNVGPEIEWPILIQGLYSPNGVTVTGTQVPF